MSSEPTPMPTATPDVAAMVRAAVDLALGGTATPIPTPTPPPQPSPTPTPLFGTEARSDRMSAAIAAAIQECSQDPVCRLDVSNDQLRALYEGTNHWALTEKPGLEGRRVFSALSHDGQIAVVWMDQSGVIFVKMLASVPNVFSNWAAPSPEAELRRITSAIVPQPWEYDYVRNIMSVWSGLDTNPAYRQSPPGGIVNGVAFQLDYISVSPAVEVTFWSTGDPTR